MSTSPTPRVRVRSISKPSSTLAASTVAVASDLRALRLSITHVPIGAITRASRQVRRRGRDQVERIAASIRHVGCVLPLPVTASHELIDGHAVLEALIQLGYDSVPVVVIDHLPPEKLRALRLSLNKLGEASTWDSDALGAEFAEMLSIDPDLIALAGFTMPEVDVCLAGFGLDPDESDADAAAARSDAPVVSQPGDIWVFVGGHELLCGNARDPASYLALLRGRRVQMVFADGPYGCFIKGHVSRSHGEFVEGSGMSESEARAFFADFLTALTAHLQDGAIVDLFIDWRGMHALVSAARDAGLVQQALCVWDKGAGGMGSLYRSQAEFVLVMKWGRARHINNVRLGTYGRNRTTVWQAPGLAQFGLERREALGTHPTVKPVGLVADALLDTSRVGGLVLDPFLGSGTTLVAAHRTRRVGLGIELDPRYVDAAVRRMEAATGAPARHAASGLTFAALAEARRMPAQGAPPAPVPSPRERS